MKLYLLRHAIAREREASGRMADADRPLTAEGKARLRRGIAGMRALGLRFDRVFSSPLVRARETAELVARKIPGRPEVELTHWLEPGARFTGLMTMLRGLRPAPEQVLLVGHEPDLGRLISFLLTGEPRFSFPLKKAGLACLTIELSAPHAKASLDWLLTAGQLRRCG